MTMGETTDHQSTNDSVHRSTDGTTPPRICPSCRDRRIRAYQIDYSEASQTGQCCVWQCYGCGALLEPGTYRTRVVGYDVVVLPHGIKGEGSLRPAPISRTRGRGSRRGRRA